MNIEGTFVLYLSELKDFSGKTNAEKELKRKEYQVRIRIANLNESDDFFRIKKVREKTH